MNEPGILTPHLNEVAAHFQRTVQPSKTGGTPQQSTLQSGAFRTTELQEDRLGKLSQAEHPQY